MHCRFPHLALLIRASLLAFALLLGTACGPAAYRWDSGHADPAVDRTYEVKSGDTLYSIAWRYGLDYRELAARNGIGAGYTIYPGQTLALVGGRTRTNTSAPRTAARAQPPADTPPVKSLPRGAWRWPAQGPVIAKFGDANATGKGVAIGGAEGDSILASAAGKVVYAGSGLIGYGKIIIIKHSEEFLSAYGHNENINVREGEQVGQGDRIASMGRGPGNKPLLHFEIRINGNAVDPLPYLPAR